MSVQNDPSQLLKEDMYIEEYEMTVKEHKVNLNKPYYKILYLYPAYDETFVFLGMLGLRQDSITHVDKHGKVLFEFVFSKPMDALGMMENDEVILLETREKWYLGPQGGEQTGPCITILNLRTHEFKRTKFPFFNEQTDQTSIRTFSETKLLCIQEDGRYNDNRFKLSYFQYPLTSESKPINIYESKDNEWTYEYIVKQANNHSMLAWFKARHDEEWFFRTYDLRDHLEGKLNEYCLKQELGIEYGISKVQVALNNMWECSRGTFMFVGISNKTEEQKNKDLGVIQNIYICDVKEGKVKQSTVSFGELHDLTIDQYNLGEISMFRTFDFKDGKPLETPIYYVCNRTKKIIAQQTWQCSYLHKDEPTGVNTNTLIHSQYENGDCDWFINREVSFKRKYMNKSSVMYFLEALKSDFDEDLLQDVVEMMDYRVD